MEIEFSRPALAALTVLVVTAALVVLGRAVTPSTGNGDLLVLSPAYVATVRYLKAAQGRLDRLAEVDADLVRVLEAQGNIYTQGRDAERAFEKALATAREIEQRRAPLSLATLQTALSHAAGAYVQAARAALLWVSAPTAENRQAVDAALEMALAGLSESRALQEGLWPAR